MALDIAVVVNPVAGIGGAVGLKGSDGEDTQRLALARGGKPRGGDRLRRFLKALPDPTFGGAVRWHTWFGAMGHDVFVNCGIEVDVAMLGAASPDEEPDEEPDGEPDEELVPLTPDLAVPPRPTTPQDTIDAIRTLCAPGNLQSADLLIFAGGDGTARLVADVVPEHQVVLGIPAGVKMHSGVFATSPERAARLVERLVSGDLVGVTRGDVRDVDEDALREGRLVTRYFGELTVPVAGGYLQHTKVGGVESEPLAVEEIVAQMAEQIAALETPHHVVLGPGSTLARIKESLGLTATLLGVDVITADGRTLTDVAAADLLELSGACIAMVSFTRSQGFLFGRGNHQFSPAFLSRLPRDDIWVVGTRSKLITLQGRPLLIDTDDLEFDRRFAGAITVVTGFEDRLLYRVEHSG